MEDYLASASTWKLWHRDDPVQFWNFDQGGTFTAWTEGEPESGFEGNTGCAVLSLDFTPNQQRLVAGCHDGSARIWNLRVNDIDSSEIILKRHGTAVSSLAFNGDGMLLATGSWDSTAGLWFTEIDDLLRPVSPLGSWIAQRDVDGASVICIIGTYLNARAMNKILKLSVSVHLNKQMHFGCVG